MVEAAASTRITKKTKDVQLGEVIQIGSSKFVKIGNNRWMAVEAPQCLDPVLNMPGSIKNFDYTGGEQTYTAYAGCQYKLEVWGAQGGNYNSTYRGGYGAYAVGVFSDAVNTTLNFHIGGQPKSETVIGSKSGYDCVADGSCGQIIGGYNGGGIGYRRQDAIMQAGGGASHVSLISGQLSSLSSHKSDNSMLLVAGGGGGGAYYDSSRNGVGGNGGGVSGANGRYGNNSNCESYGYGANQSQGGLCYILSVHAYQKYGCPARGAFGNGGVGLSNVGGSGGGGGYYGGGGVNCLGGGGGGSGYIGSSYLVSTASITKHMTCCNCSTSTADATRTQSNTCVSATATADCSKTGNGYARITRLN